MSGCTKNYSTNQKELQITSNMLMSTVETLQKLAGDMGNSVEATGYPINLPAQSCDTRRPS